MILRGKSIELFCATPSIVHNVVRLLRCALLHLANLLLCMLVHDLSHSYIITLKSISCDLIRRHSRVSYSRSLGLFHSLSALARPLTIKMMTQQVF